MKLACIGTDPAGLYLAILMRSRDPDTHVTVYDTGSPDRSAAPPHILTNPVKPELRLADAEVAAAIAAASVKSNGVQIRRDGETLRSAGHRYTSIPAAQLAAILCERAKVLGCTFLTGPLPGGDITELADVVVIADGAASPERAKRCDGFKPFSRPSRSRFMLLTLNRPATEPAFMFRRTPEGLFHAVRMPAGVDSSTLIVAAEAVTLAAAGLEAPSVDSSLALLAKVFGADLDGATLTATGHGWHAFSALRNGTWTSGNLVLLGAAAYNAHYTIGLGARSGLEDAEALATLLSGGAAVDSALAKFEAVRRPRAESLQRASQASLAWFEHAQRYIDMPLPQFAYALLTRSLRLNHESMRALAPDLVDQVETLLAGDTRTKTNRPPPPMFTPIKLRGLTIPNRIVMSPMCMYNADDGTVGDFHLVHYGSRAMGGAGLIITEMTDVSPEGRISAHCAGMYKHEHVAAWRRVTDFVHTRTASKIGVQLGHSGRKGAEPRPWERAAHKGPAWQTMAPSPIPLLSGGVPPREVERTDMDRLVTAYANAARMSHEAGFDFLELHFAHGYLLSTFISPLSNKRTDHYGGSLANRLRFPMEVFEAVRAAWPQDKPTCVRISAYDWDEGGTTIEDAIVMGRTLRDAGNDILSVSAGGVTMARPAPGRLYQAGFSDQIRNELKITTMNVGGMASHGDINAMIAAGRADMCALARGHLFDPYFTRHAAHQQNYQDLAWPNEYERAATLDMKDF